MEIDMEYKVYIVSFITLACKKKEIELNETVDCNNVRQ